MDWQIPLSDLDYGPEEEAAVMAVLRRRWLTMGAVTREFEKQFAEHLSVKHAVAVSNATVALHLACVALGLGPGDEVIVPSLTFVATANAVLYTGADVRFADICGAHDLNVNPQSIEEQITPRTRAIIVVHYGGYACQMPAICAIAERHGLEIIEDAAHAPGASLNGKALGSWGAAGCFSFFSNKNLATGEGGMFVTDRDDLAERARLLRSHGMTSLTWDRHHGHAYSYDVVDIGYNYRMDEIRSALGLAQLEKLARNNKRRGELVAKYTDALAGLDVEIPFLDSQGISSWHIMPILLPTHVDRRRFMDHMKQSGVQTSIHYPPIHFFQYYRDRYPEVLLPQTEKVAAHEVTLPLYPTMGEDAVALVAEAVAAALHKNSL